MIFLPTSAALILTFLASKGFSEIIHCYECDDCKSSNDTLLRACPQSLSTTAPDNLAPSEPITTTATAPITIEVPAPIASTTTLATTTDLPDPTTTTAPALKPATTLASVSSTTSGDGTASDGAAGDGAAGDGDDTGDGAAGDGAESNDDGNTEEVRKRSVRHVSYRSLMVRRFARETEVTHHCYSIKGYDGDKNKIKRGCVKVTGIEKACDVLKKQFNVSAESCVVCKKNKCNNSGVRNLDTILYPVLGLLFGFLIQNV